jgi:hypothetical protein
MKKLFTSIIVYSFIFTAFTQDNTLPASGNVGVGTLNPTARLNVNGNVKIDSSLVINDSLRVNKTIRVMDKVYIEGKTVMGDNAVVKQNFKVLGNTNFDGNATVDGNLKLPNVETLSNNNFTNGNFSFLVLNDNGVAKKGGPNDLLNAIYSPANKQCDDAPITNPTWSNGTNKIFVNCPQVFVGINTSQPRSSLDVKGTTYTNNLAIGIDPTQMEGKFHIKHFNSSPNSKILTIENNTRKLLTLDNSGLLRAREIKIDTEIWPDYVFEKNYGLMPLNEVESFIELYGHLPNIPSSETMVAEGINLAEMNRLLLEKVEELTLYMIELDKKNNILSQKIKFLETIDGTITEPYK